MKKFLSYFFVTILIFLSRLVSLAAGWALDTFGNISVDEIIFHLKMPLEGTNPDYFVNFAKSCVLPALTFTLPVLLFIIVFLTINEKVSSLDCRLCLKFSVREKTKRLKLFPLRFLKPVVMLGTLVFLVYSVTSSANAIDLTSYIKAQATSSKFIEENYVRPSNDLLTYPEQKRNLIYIFLESVETTFMSKEEGGAFDYNCIPELTQLARDNISFSGNDQFHGGIPTVGTTWTMGAMFAQTTALPLNIPIGMNSMSEYQEFFPGVTGLGDLLDEAGYKNYLCIGSDVVFGGRKNYFQQHGNYEIWDYYSAIENKKIPEDYYMWWGYEDSKLFDYAKEQLLEISAKGEPFNYTMLTADTHFEDGYYCPLCEDEFDTQYANVYACSSRQLNAFIQWIQQQDFYENTTVILCGDHLTMDMDFCEDVPESYPRGVYNAILNSAVEPATQKDREFTTMDMFPTTLASMGIEIQGDRLGLGVNLFSDQPTLIQEYGIDQLNEELSSKSTFYNSELLYSKE
ncbi:LTA synthase family protein [Diplocloster agilis]|uniref:LTA synthase family protein n=1 Tax=Diplocloster agilis TaxID=2850323 RepID=A0A949K7A7_9FIRM|nr:LTA synthase family protein [Diplocloster agilis]MBU9739251.1 LTA synthase family protein [Diplocloster agilis]